MRVQPSFELNPPQRNDPRQIDTVARQLEGQFAQMLVKSMREASFGDPLFPGENTLFRDMYDQKIAEAMTRGKGLGLSAVIGRQLSGAGAGPAPLDARLEPTRASPAFGPGAASEAAGLPVDEADRAVRLLQQMAAGTAPATREPMQQTLDLIAGRESGALHQALGRAEPYAATVAGGAAPTLPDDQWQATADNRGSVPSAVDTLASSAAVARLGAHTPEGFVAGIWPHAQSAARELGVDARALVAQAALETGWGRRQIAHGDGRSTHNLFGIKATAWSGDRATTATHEYVGGVRRSETASFRSYASPAESFADYVRLLKRTPRYQKALQAGTDVRRFAQGLQQAGYATDPAYASKIARIAGGPTIERAVAAVGDASAQLGRTFASTAQVAATATRR